MNLKCFKPLTFLGKEKSEKGFLQQREADKPYKQSVHAHMLCFCLLSPTDVDECRSGPSRCSHGCINTLGSFSCMCHPGFELGADGKQCYRKY